MGEGWVAVRGLGVPTEEEGIASHDLFVGGIGREVTVKLVVGAGREHVCSGVDLEKAAGVAEDDGVEHDVFIGAAREIDVWCLDSDTSDKGYLGPGTEGQFENGWATCVVRGDPRVDGRGIRTRT